MKSDRIKNWPKEERPRERLRAEGAEKLTDAELPAIILRVGQGTFKEGMHENCKFRSQFLHSFFPQWLCLPRNSFHLLSRRAGIQEGDLDGPLLFVCPRSDSLERRNYGFSNCPTSIHSASIRA